jgi:hypothetical protein
MIWGCAIWSVRLSHLSLSPEVSTGNSFSGNSLRGGILQELLFNLSECHSITSDSCKRGSKHRSKPLPWCSSAQMLFVS